MIDNDEDSGFLVAYFLYERLIAGKSMQWFLIYFHRIWRIMPMYVVVMFLWAFLTPFLGEGPFWWQYKQIVEHTSPNCWSNLLFINNFYPPSSNDQVLFFSSQSIIYYSLLLTHIYDGSVWDGVGFWRWICNFISSVHF